MSEWGVFGVIVALFGFAVAIITPIIRLNTNITTLTVTLERMDKDVEGQKKSSHEAHRRLWEKNEEQDTRINDHEKRLSLVEKQGQ